MRKQLPQCSLCLFLLPFPCSVVHYLFPAGREIICILIWPCEAAGATCEEEAELGTCTLMSPRDACAPSRALQIL